MRSFNLALALPALAPTPEDWADVARLWGVADLPGRRGHTAVEMFEAAARDGNSIAIQFYKRCLSIC